MHAYRTAFVKLALANRGRTRIAEQCAEGLERPFESALREQTSMLVTV
jgi:hypothetical protein